MTKMRDNSLLTPLHRKLKTDPVKEKHKMQGFKYAYCKKKLMHHICIHIRFGKYGLNKFIITNLFRSHSLLVLTTIVYQTQGHFYGASCFL